MAKYEIMLIVSGSLEQSKATEIANDISNSIKDCKPVIDAYGSKQLAYKIKNDTNGYFFQYNFECESPAQINEFRRLCLINKNVLRHLIINLEKDYAYKASTNAKKIANTKKSIEINEKRRAEIEKARINRAAGNNEELNNETLGRKPRNYRQNTDRPLGTKDNRTRTYSSNYVKKQSE